jgi:hypothetical protein
MKIVYLLAAAVSALLVSVESGRAQPKNDQVEAAIRAEYAYKPRKALRSASALSVSERRELMEWLRGAAGKGHVPVAHSDPRELKLLDLLHKAAGRPPASKLLSVLGGVRAISAKLDACAQFLKEHDTNGLFMDVGVTGDKLTAATLQSTFMAGKPQNVRNFGTVLIVLDSDGKEVTDAAGLSNKGETTLLIDAPPAQGVTNEDKPPIAAAVFTTFMTDGTPCRTRLAAQVFPPPTSIEVTAPNNPQNRNTVLCLNRSAPAPPAFPLPCDFGPFPQAGIDGGKATVVVPMAGTIMMPYPIAPQKDGTIAQLQVTAINTQDGTPCKDEDVDKAKEVLAQTTVTADKKGLTWSILGDKALTFGKSCYQPHSGLAFNMTWAVSVTRPNGKTATIAAVISNILTQGSANTLIVRNVDLQWGCVPAGTRITLFDGERRPIETLTPGDLVLGADGKPWQVINLLHGGDSELTVVTAEDGTVARMTADHPVITGRADPYRPRWVMASKLSAGMPLVTAEGDSKVAAVERRPYDGKVYNLVLRPQGDDRTPAHGATFYADGLLVGDQTMQGLPAPGPAPAVAGTSRSRTN